MEDIAGFLGSHPPFDALDADDLARVAAVTELESFPAGKTIFSQGAGPVEYLWVVRAGAVEIIHNGRVLDLLGPGELFGHASMISGLPTGFEARAAEDTVCCRIPADVMRPLLARADVLRFVARSIVTGRDVPVAALASSADPVQRHVETLIRTPPLLCRADEPIREAAKQMTAEGASALLAQFALSFRPPTGFLRDFVVEHSGERRGQLDIKHGGLIPIVDLARWAGVSAGVGSASTVERLRAAEAAGTLDNTQARTLMEAFGYISSLRLDHQVEQLRRGETPADFIDPKTLNPLARSYLREAFRAVASVQSGLSNELSLGIRWG